MASDPRRSLSAYARSSGGHAQRAARAPDAVDVVDGRYRVLRTLGRGGMGTVMLAEDLRLGREVAVKLLSPELAHTDALRRRFLEEARAMGGLRHDHVAQVYSYGTHGIEPYIVMEYVPGETVVDFMSRWEGRLDVDVAIGIVDQLARGLAAIHAAGIIHGDIKPSNVLVGPGFRAVVVDFGLMRWLGDAEDLSIVVGTPAYIPPEVVRADSIELRLTPAADVFALGVTAFEMLTGRLPFVVTNVDELFDVHLRGTKAPRVSSLRPELPDALDEVFARVLSGDLSERYRSADDFRRALGAARAAGTMARALRTVVVADADTDARASLAVALEQALDGASVRTASDEATLRAAVENEPVDAVVVDVGITRDPAALVRALRSTARGQTVPIVMIGRDVSPADHRELRALGISGCVPKPVNAATLAGLAHAISTRRESSGSIRRV